MIHHLHLKLLKHIMLALPITLDYLMSLTTKYAVILYPNFLTRVYS